MVRITIDQAKRGLGNSPKYLSPYQVRDLQKGRAIAGPAFDE